VVSALFDEYDRHGSAGVLTTDGVLHSIAETVPLSRTMKEKVATLRTWCRTRARPPLPTTKARRRPERAPWTWTPRGGRPVSHFTQVETKINDLACLKLALADLNAEFEVATEDQLVKVRGWKGSTLTAEAKIKASKSYDIGLQLTEEGTYKLVADWWGIEEETNETQEKITQRIVQRYAYHKVKKEVAAQGFTMDEEQVQADGTIKLGVSKW